MTTTDPETEAVVADPRPRLTADGRLEGGRCASCGHVVAGHAARCPSCGRDAVEPAAFGPAGVVWSATTLHVAAAGRRTPYALAYVDVEDGPRVVAHVDVAPAVGARVELAGTTREGDIRVRVTA